MSFYIADTIDIRLYANDDSGDMQKLIIKTYLDVGTNFDGSQYMNTEELMLPTGGDIIFNSTSPFRPAAAIESYFLEFNIIDKEGLQSLPFITFYEVVDEPLINSSYANYDFGNIAVSSLSSITITISNIGVVGDIYTSQLQISGTDIDQFSISNDNCSRQTISPSGSKTVNVTFRPSGVGVKNATLEIPYNHLDTPVLSIPLIGTGI